MMYELEEARNICCSYNFTDCPDTGDEHGMLPALFEPISNILCIRVLQDYGVSPTEALLTSANSGITSLGNLTFQLRETQYPRRMPRGSGSSLRYNRWNRFFRPAQRVPLICTSERMVDGEVNDFSYDFNSYLRRNEDIESFTIVHTGGLIVLSSSEENGFIHYRIRAMSPTENEGLEQLRIKITTTTERVEERLVNFEVTPITNDPNRFIGERNG